MLESETGVLMLGENILWNIPGVFRGTKFHLYFVSDDEVQINDWAIQQYSHKYGSLASIGIRNVIKADAKTDPFYFGDSHYNEAGADYFKIIASTDPSLNLPLISEHFMAAYIEQGGIDEVLVEFNGNSIITFPIKDTWTREEVIALCAKAHGHGYDLCLGTTDDKLEFKDWIKNQL